MGVLAGLLLAVLETLLRYLPALSGTDLAPSALLPVTAGVLLAVAAGAVGLLHRGAAVAVVVGAGLAGGGLVGAGLGGLAAGLALAAAQHRGAAAGVLLSGVLGALALRSPPPQTCTAPVVGLVVMDTVGAAATSLHGHDLPTTPHLEALADRGLWFETALSPAPWTLPAHAAMFTGGSPRTVGGHHERLALDETVATLAERLAAAGWRTGAFVANPWIARQTGMTRGFSHQEHHSEISDAGGRFSVLSLLPIARNKGGRGLVKRALSWVGRCDGQPTFVFVNLLEAHSPFHQNADPGRFGVADPTRVSERMAAVQLRGPSGAPGFPEAGEVDAAWRVYAAGVAEADALVGTLVAGLPDASLVVTSDHGEAFGEHGFYGHMIGIHTEVLHVPLVVVGPSVDPGVVSAPVSTARVHDTVLSLAGLPGEGSLLSGEHDVPVFSEQLRPVLKLDDLSAAETWMDSRQARVQLGSTVLIQRVVREGPVQWWLYDTQSDPEEQRSLWRPGAAPTLAGVLQEHTSIPVAHGEGVALDAVLRARLHALGYVEE